MWSGERAPWRCRHIMEHRSTRAHAAVLRSLAQGAAGHLCTGASSPSSLPFFGVSPVLHRPHFQPPRSAPQTLTRKPASHTLYCSAHRSRAMASNRELQQRGEALAQEAREARQEAASGLGAAPTGGMGGERLAQETTVRGSLIRALHWAAAAPVRGCTAAAPLLPGRLGRLGRSRHSPLSSALSLPYCLTPLPAPRRAPAAPTPRAAASTGCWAAWARAPRRPPLAPHPT